MSLTAKLPDKNKKEEYSLYVSGKITYMNTDKELGTLIILEGSGVAFYSASNSRRAYIFQDASEKSCGIPCEEGFIPYFKQKVRILYKAKGRKIELLKFMIYNLEKKYGDKIYKLNSSYWIMLGSYIDSIQTKKKGKNNTKRIPYLITEKYLKRQENSNENN